VGVLHQRTAGTPGTKVDFHRARKRMVFALKGTKKVAGSPQKQYSSVITAAQKATASVLF
jgi:hypothetical protein